MTDIDRGFKAGFMDSVDGNGWNNESMSAEYARGYAQGFQAGSEARYEPIFQ
jgi:hypothetical protein